MVIAIIALLASFVLVAVGSLTARARSRRTAALLDRLDAQISEYYHQTGELPPDGMDAKFAPGGVPLRSSAALWYVLSNPIIDTYEVAGEEKVREVEAVATFEPGDLLEDDENPGMYTIVDGFGYPLHYDNQLKRADPPEEELDGSRFDPSDTKGLRQSSLGYAIWSFGLRTAEEESAEEEAE